MKLRYSILLLLFLASCKKEQVDNGEHLAGINFQNASTELIAVLRKAQTSQKAVILLDSPIVYTPDASLKDKAVQLPFFDNGFNNRNNRNLYFYPNPYFNTDEPWVTYMRTSSGLHHIGVADTAKNRLVYTSVTLEPDQRYSVFITDSAGVYAVIPAKDEQQDVRGKIRIRVAHMSPSNDQVYLSAGNNKEEAFKEGLHFKQVSAYHELKLDSIDSHYPVRLYKKEDPSVPVARALINAIPGRSYTLIFRGYTSTISYKDRFGTNIIIAPNAEIFKERTN